MSANVLHHSPSLRKRLSSLTTNVSSNSVKGEGITKSDIYVMSQQGSNVNPSGIFAHGECKTSEESEDSRKDDKITNSDIGLGEGDSGNQFISNLLTDSEKKLRDLLLENVRKIQSSEESVYSLESNIKLLKKTVEEIFDKFYKNMKDFDLYKNKYNEILTKNRNDIIAEMEEFIKEVLQYIMSDDNIENKDREEISDIMTTNTGSVSEQLVTTDDLFDIAASRITFIINDTSQNVSSANEQTIETEHDYKENLNIYFLNHRKGNINERNLHSEMNIKACNRKHIKEKKVASAENFNKIAQKKLQVEKYISEDYNADGQDKEIPIKVSQGMKNLVKDERFGTNSKIENETNILIRFCTYFCRKLKKNFKLS